MHMEKSVVIKTNGLSKKYKGSQTYALKDLDIEVKKGEVFGFLGPNGAGKSTTIRLLLNFIQPTQGSAEILNKNIAKIFEVRGQIGYLSGDFKAYDKMTGNQFLDYMGSIQPPKTKKYMLSLAKRFDVNLNKRIGDLSKGNRQKIGIVQAFMSQPEVIILDEPTDGLDPLMQDEFYDLVGEFKKAGATFFISSHNLAEVRKICERVAIIKEGKLVSQSTITDLIEQSAQKFRIKFTDKAPSAEIKSIKEAKVTKNHDGSLSVQMSGNLKPLFRLLSKYDIESIQTHELNLEDEFMQFYERQE